MNALEIVSTRNNPGIDPGLHIWGWEIPVYLFLGGLVAGLMILQAAVELRSKERSEAPAWQVMPFVAAGLISLGMGALFLDLEHKLYVWRFYLALRPSSPMSWGAWILVAVYPALVLHGLGSLDEARRGALRARVPGALKGLLDGLFGLSDRHRRVVLGAVLALGVGLGAYTGLLLGTLAARIQWSSSVLAPLFLVSGISTGAAFLMLFRIGDREKHQLVRWDIAAIVVELGLLAILLLGYVTGGQASQQAADMLLGGRYTPWFWSLVVFTGLLVPLALNVLEVRKHLPMTLFSPALVLVGGLALRAVLVAAGQVTSYGAMP